MGLNPIFGIRPVGGEPPSQAEAEAGTATIRRVWTAERVRQAIVAGGFPPRSYLAGLALVNGADATNDINIAVGKARNDADDENLVVAAAIGKQIDVSFAAGGIPFTPTGGLSSSLTLTNDTWYHVILGLVSGTEEVGFDTSAGGSNLVTDHSFTNIRRIGSVRRGTATNLAFSQLGDEFLLKDPLLDVDVTNQSTTSVSYTLTTPLGVKTHAILNLVMVDGAATAAVYVRSLDANDEAASLSAGPLSSIAPGAGHANEMAIGPIHIRTNTLSQIAARANAAIDNFRVATLGWIDPRGRDD